MSTLGRLDPTAFSYKESGSEMIDTSTLVEKPVGPPTFKFTGVGTSASTFSKSSGSAPKTTTSMSSFNTNPTKLFTSEVKAPAGISAWPTTVTSAFIPAKPAASEMPKPVATKKVPGFSSLKMLREEEAAKKLHKSAAGYSKDGHTKDGTGVAEMDVKIGGEEESEETEETEEETTEEEEKEGISIGEEDEGDVEASDAFYRLPVLNASGGGYFDNIKLKLDTSGGKESSEESSEEGDGKDKPIIDPISSKYLGQLGSDGKGSPGARLDTKKKPFSMSVTVPKTLDSKKKSSSFIDESIKQTHELFDKMQKEKEAKRVSFASAPVGAAKKTTTTIPTSATTTKKASLFAAF